MPCLLFTIRSQRAADLCPFRPLRHIKEHLICWKPPIPKTHAVTDTIALAKREEPTEKQTPSSQFSICLTKNIYYVLSELLIMLSDLSEWRHNCWYRADNYRSDTQYRICLSSVPDDQPVILLHLKQCWMESTMAHKGICNVFAEHTCDIRILKKWDAELSTGFLLWWHPHKDILLGLLNVWKATCDVVWRPLKI